MKIAEGCEMLEISANVMGTERLIHPVLFWDDNTVMLADTGFPGQLPQIKEAMDKTGVPFNRLNTIIFTHHDIDHIGNAGSIFKELGGSIKVIAHETEKTYINGEKTPLKLAYLEKTLNTLPEERKAVYQQMKAGFQNNRVDVDKTVVDGEELPCCGGIIVIFTPGHTLGHICLYHKESKTLVAGDLLTIDSGKLVPSRPSIQYDLDICRDSMKRLTNYDIANVICYHGGFFNNQSNQSIWGL
jgi:glyoxylase-like metal-dependent hydrolase (beta-lactamase superfamily II)